jgi:GNAT superfamily N-acetyltransferase
MKQIKIFPIFNQDANGVWDKFIEIRVAAYAGDKIFMDSQDIANARNILESEWKSKRGNFAYGAYDGADMIGHISGYYEKDYAFVANLYILPEYQGNGCGRSLLNAAEKSAAVFKKELGLLSSYYARRFYVKQGYFLAESDDFYQKEISKQGRGIVTPLFFYNSMVAKKSEELSKGADILTSKTINKQHKPVFVYRDINNVISGYCVVDTSVNAKSQKYYTSNDWVKERLITPVDDYLKQYKLLQQKSR